MRNSKGWWIIIVVMLLLDLYVFQVVRYLTQGSGDKTRIIIHSSYWLISLSAIILMILLPYINYDNWPRSTRNYLFAILVGLFFAKLLGAIFFLADDIRRGAMWSLGKMFSNPSIPFKQSADGISRSAFLSWAGISVGTILFGSLLTGFRNKYNYRVERVKVPFKNLPAAFNGLKIAQISDIHAGSLSDKKAVQHGVDMILALKPDLILFTGDMVNDKAEEMKELIDVFSKLQAPLGVFSVLGNHDYGDYVKWESPALKAANLEELKTVHKALGWKLMMNEHVIFERGLGTEVERIALVGVENWGAKGNFPKYGKLAEACRGTEAIPFKLLMSHDPSHWDGEVRPEFKDIALTLSGHTHGMQFGVELPGFQWSPVQFMYKQWGGLYKVDQQALYVNRGFGFIGYPGRVGILPEITLIELEHQA